MSKKQYKQRFRPIWRTQENLKDWLREIRTDATRAYCIYCKKTIQAKKNDIEYHATSKSHKQHEEVYYTNEMKDRREAEIAKLELNRKNKLIEEKRILEEFQALTEEDERMEAKMIKKINKMKYEIVGKSCRVCLHKSNKMRCIYKPQYDGEKSPNEMLQQLTGIDLENVIQKARLPQYICKRCELSLNISHQFRRNALKCQHIIEVFCNQKIINEDEKFDENAVEIKIETNTMDVDDMDSHITDDLIMYREVLNPDIQSNYDEIEEINGENDDDDNDSDNHVEYLCDDEHNFKLNENSNDEFLKYEKSEKLNDPVEVNHDDDDDENFINENNDIEESIIDENDINEQDIVGNVIDENDIDGNDVDEHDIDDFNDIQLMKNVNFDVEVLVDAQNKNYHDIIKTNTEKSIKNKINIIASPSTRSKRYRVINDKDGVVDLAPNSKTTKKAKIAKAKSTHICDICGNVFNQRGRMMEHRRRHNKELRFPCEICAESFHLRELLRKHMYVHSGGKPHKCSFCSRTFYYESVKRAHEEIHKGARPYICNYCDKSFAYSHGLDKHLLIHKNIKLHHCEYCNKDFRLQHHMKQHEETKMHQNAVRAYQATKLALQDVGTLS